MTEVHQGEGKKREKSDGKRAEKPAGKKSGHLTQNNKED